MARKSSEWLIWNPKRLPDHRNFGSTVTCRSAFIYFFFLNLLFIAITGFEASLQAFPMHRWTKLGYSFLVVYQIGRLKRWQPVLLIPVFFHKYSNKSVAGTWQPWLSICHTIRTRVEWEQNHFITLNLEARELLDTALRGGSISQVDRKDRRSVAWSSVMNDDCVRGKRLQNWRNAFGAQNFALNSHHVRTTNNCSQRRRRDMPALSRIAATPASALYAYVKRSGTHYL